MDASVSKQELILVIDDAEAICQLIKDALGLSGYNVISAGGVQAGIEKALAEEPELILCDVVLGDGSGYDVLDALQQDDRLAGVPFIFISGEAIDARDIRRGMSRGADDYLPKPFRLQELLEAVEARLKRARRMADTQLRMARCFAGSFENLGQVLAELSANETPFCLLAVGLHRFERFLRLFGWQQAEGLIQQMVERLLGQLEGVSPEAYHSHEPDKFYLLWRGEVQPQAARGMVQRVLRCLGQPQDWGEHVLRLGAQAGVVLGSPTEAATKAEIALHQATAQGPGSVVFFEEGYEQSMRSDLKWEQELHAALEQGWFEIFYQPQFELQTRRLCGAEALLRLRHPQLGMVSPATFIPVAEDCGLMLPIGSWVLETACAQIHDWWQNDGLLLRVAVNVSQIQFQRQDFTEVVAGVLEKTGLPPSALELELTESMLMQRPKETLQQLQKLKQLGLSLAMDDFGTGYSSLASLSRLPFDILKIDQSFVFGLDAQPTSQAIPRAITQMGQSLGMKILAEGIESEEHLQWLRQMGCEMGQGFFLGRPQPAQELRQLWQGPRP